MKIRIFGGFARLKRRLSAIFKVSCHPLQLATAESNSGLDRSSTFGSKEELTLYDTQRRQYPPLIYIAWTRLDMAGVIGFSSKVLSFGVCRIFLGRK
jgi:hypothetical protein